MPPPDVSGSFSQSDVANSNASQDGRPAPRMGAIQFLLYNMSAMLAGVAAGYDVRLSNVTPIHPKLHPKRFEHILHHIFS